MSKLKKYIYNILIFSLVLLAALSFWIYTAVTEENIWADFDFKWSLREPFFDIFLYLPQDVDASHEELEKISEALTIFTYHVPTESFNVNEPLNDEIYRTIVSDAVWNTDFLNYEDHKAEIDKIIKERNLPDYLLPAVTKEMVQKTVDHYFAGNIKVDGKKFLKALGTTGKRFWTMYNEECQLFWIQASRLGEKVPFLLNYDRKSNTAEVSFIVESYCILYDKEGNKLWDITSQNEVEGKKKLAKYLENRAPRYLIKFNDDMKIESFMCLSMKI